MTIASANGKKLFTALALTVAMVIAAACGGDTPTPGESNPKRTLDPRSEAIRYFPASTESIALLTTEDATAMAALNESLAALPAWHEIRESVYRSLESVDIDPETILQLSRSPADDIELPAPEIAFGAVPGSGSAEERALFTLATEQGVELDRTFKEAADTGRLEPAGEFDGARLYRGTDLDFAVRDGVLIAAANINRLQQAIARRDGDRSAQLDDAPIAALMNSLPESGTLRAYSGDNAVSDRVMALVLGAMAASSDSTDTGEEDPAATMPEALEAAMSARAQDGGLAVDLVVTIEQPDPPSDQSAEVEPDPDEEPIPIAITAAAIDTALAALPPDAPLRDLGRLEQLAGAAWIEGDQLRARLITTPPSQ